MARSLGDRVRRVVFERSLRPRECDHADAARVLEPVETACPGCSAEGSKTVSLRMCMTCGQPGCCDSSPAQHARRHHEETGHPLIRSVEPGDRWAFCYVDDAYWPDANEIGNDD